MWRKEKKNTKSEIIGKWVFEKRRRVLYLVKLGLDFNEEVNGQSSEEQRVKVHA